MNMDIANGNGGFVLMAFDEGKIQDGPGAPSGLIP